LKAALTASIKAEKRYVIQVSDTTMFNSITEAGNIKQQTSNNKQYI
jgi:hypothetical protein